jgi:26S proteasome regulatory subunit N10
LTRVRSHIVTIPPGPHLLSDLVATSPILQGEGGAVGAAGADGFPPDFEDVPGGAAAAGGADEFGGIDPNMDPELAMVRVMCGGVWLNELIEGTLVPSYQAIRMSLQEAEERERREREAAGGSAEAPAAPAATESAESSTQQPAAATSSESAPLLSGTHDSDVSMDAAEPTEAAAAPSSAPAVPHEDTEMAAAGAEDEEDEDEEAAMLKAIAMSMEGQGGEGGDHDEEKKKE